MLERLGLSPTPPEGHRFHGFISYSHAADGQLAPALQKGLQRFAKPWYRARALRIFRDDASMDVTANLWRAIEQALVDSEHYILLASPLAASSEWVAKEAEQWARTKSVHTLLVALTDGELVWDRDGRLLASASADDDTVRLWEVATGRQIGAPITDDAQPFNAVAFSPDGTTLATAGGDGAVRLWDVATQSQLGAALYQPQAVTAVAFSPDGRRVLAASSDVRVYSDAAIGDCVRLLCTDFTDTVAKTLLGQADPSVAYRRPCPA